MAIIDSVQDGNIIPCEKKVVLYGNGPHTKVVYGYLYQSPLFAGFVVDDHVLPDQPEIDGVPVRPLSQIQYFFPAEQYVVIVAVAFRDLNELRRTKSMELESLGYQFASYLDDSVRLPNQLTVAPNCIILDHVAINHNTHIDYGSFVSSGAILGHDTFAQAFNWIGSGAVLAGGIQLGEACMLGLNCSIKQNCQLGHHTLITPNTFVNVNTEPYSVISSEPGRKLPYDSRMVMKFAYR